MRSLSLTALVPLALAASLSSTARATPCDLPEGGLFQGPVGVTLQDGDHAGARRACPRTEVGLGVGGQLTLEPEKYGLDLTIQVASGAPILIRGGMRVFGSFAIGRRLELFGSFEPLHARYLISGYQATYAGLGHSTIGATLVAYQDDVIVVGVTQSVTLPSAVTLYHHAWPFSFDSGLTMTFSPIELVQLHAQLSGVATIAYSPALPAPKVGLLSVAGGELMLFDWASLVGDLYMMSLYNDVLDTAAFAGAIRVKAIAGLGFEAAVLAPIQGADRNLASVRLSGAYRF